MLLEEEEPVALELLLELLPDALADVPLPVDPLLLEPFALDPLPLEPLPLEPLPLDPSPAEPPLLPALDSELPSFVPDASEEPEPLPASPSAPVLPTAASLVLPAPPALLRKSVTYQPEPLSWKPAAVTCFS